MPFQEFTKMQSRQQLCQRVLHEGVPVSRAAREAGVSRVTAHKWVERARHEGISGLREISRRPARVPGQTDASIADRIIACKQSRPPWGAKKIAAVLWPEGDAPVSVRTIDRILERAGLVTKRVPAAQAVGSFERTICNALWQVDYKGVSRRLGCYPLSVLDDHSRFCLALSAQTSKSPKSAWEVLWRVMGEVGVPEAILTDNGDGFNDWQAQGPTRFEANCLLLGIVPVHGRVRHPQTQGKVERFHLTLEIEAGAGLHGSAGLYKDGAAGCQDLLDRFRACYNWERPHEALGMRVPGSVYRRSDRVRARVMPLPEIAPGAVTRRVCINGHINFHGRTYLVGKGLTGEMVEVREGVAGYDVYFAGHRILSLAQKAV